MGMAKTLSNRDLNRLLSAFEADGHTVKGTKSGYQVRHKSGTGMITMHLTLSDARAMKNLRSDALKNGFTWPLD